MPCGRARTKMVGPRCRHWSRSYILCGSTPLPLVRHDMSWQPLRHIRHWDRGLVPKTTNRKWLMGSRI